MDILDFKEDYFIYSTKGNSYKVLYQDLLVVEYDKPLVCLYMKANKFIIQRSLEFVCKSLKEYFVQVNRQVVINMKYIECIICEQNSYWVIMKNGAQYKISGRREKIVRDAFRMYV